MFLVGEELVNKGVWECIKAAGSYREFKRRAVDAGLCLATAGSLINHMKIGKKPRAICSKEFDVVPEAFDELVLLSVREENV